VSAVTRILGIDPGSRYTGYGVIEAERGRSRIVACGRIDATRGTMPERLLLIQDTLSALLVEHTPQEAAMEEVFVSKNAQSALVLGQARGVALCACARAGLAVAEYATSSVKLALTGQGRADKEQVQHMVKVLLNLRERIALDASDALAVALTHAHVRSTQQRSGLTFARAWGGA
jgi:crossover junction endodeoxyribonuclease RuvC